MAEGYTIRGAAHLFKLELNQAVSDLSQAISLRPDNALAFRWRAMAYQGLSWRNMSGNPFESLRDKDVEAVLRLIINPKEAWEYEARGYALYQKSTYDLAISDFDNALRLDPQYLIAYVIRGAARNFKKSELVDNIGLNDMAQATRLNPKFVIGYFYRGMLLYFGSKENCIDDLSEAIRLAPKGIIAYGFRGEAFESLKKYELAIRDFTEAIRLGAKVYLTNRASSYVQIGNYEFALRDYTEAIGNAPNNASNYVERAKVYRALGQIALAEADEKRAKALQKSK
jgi:tetratricopeptide (TPR) repeat protein